MQEALGRGGTEPRCHFSKVLRRTPQPEPSGSSGAQLCLSLEGHAQKQGGWLILQHLGSLAEDLQQRLLPTVLEHGAKCFRAPRGVLL